MLKRVPISTLPLTHSYLIKNSPNKTLKFGSKFPPSPRYLQNSLQTATYFEFKFTNLPSSPNKRMHTPRHIGTIFIVNPFQPGSIDPIRGCQKMTSSWTVNFLTSPSHVILISSFALLPSPLTSSSFLKKQRLKKYASFFHHFSPHKIFRSQFL